MTTVALAAIRPGSYTLDPAGSRVQFATRHMFGLGRVTGTFDVRDGTVEVAEEPTHSTVRATLDVASFATDKSRRDRDVLSPRLLDAARFPQLTFAADGVRPGADGWVVTGTLGVRDSGGPVTFTVTDALPDGTGYRVTAHARVDRYAVGFTRARGLVGRWYKLALSVGLRPAAVAASTDG